MNTKSHNQADVDENSPREKLTAKQEAFAQAIADGMTQADAYLPQGQVQTIMLGQPARQVARGEGGGLP